MSIDINAEDGLRLPSEGPGNRPRFAAIFGGVWATVQPEQKERILTYWRKFPGAPLIDLVLGHRFPGENEDYGLRLKFNARAVDWAPDEMLASLIAHELSHVLSYADPNSKSSQATMKVRGEVLEQIKEEEADALAESWGFDMGKLRSWGNESIDHFHTFGCTVHDGFRY